MTMRVSTLPKRRPLRRTTSLCDGVSSLRIAAAVVLLFGLGQSSWGGDVTVQISKRGAGKPVDAAAVCLGTPADIDQFGARLANDKGTVEFKNIYARTDLVLTVSKSGYKGRQVLLGTDQRNRGVLLTLAAGGGGPKCASAAALAQQIQLSQSRSSDVAPGIVDFRINGGRDLTRSPKVTLMYALKGEASHYRASSHSDFRAAEWQPLASEVRYDLTGDSGLKTVYFQVGKFASVEGGEIEILSNIAVDTIMLGG